MACAFAATNCLFILFLASQTQLGISKVPVTDTELSVLSEALWQADVNNVANLITINLQGYTTARGRDNAPQPLLTVDPSVYTKPTIAKLIPLQDNYVEDVGVSETVTTLETTEESQFLDAIFATSVIQKTEKFLIDKGYINTRGNGNNARLNTKAFRDALQEIWFGLYDRENRTLGSSGFEHVFIGEIKNNQVSGFHNWIFFAKQESMRKVNYNGYMSNIRLGSKGQVIKYNFKWDRTLKPVTSMFVGTSPEFEMAIYTVCFYVRSGKRCPITLNGKTINIQTHFINRRGKHYLATSYADI